MCGQYVSRDADAKAMRLERGLPPKGLTPKLDLQIVSFYKLLLTKGPSVRIPFALARAPVQWRCGVTP